MIDAEEIDRIGIHVANIEGMRRAVARLSVTPGYVLSDGFSVPGLTAPSLPVIGGDGAAACIAAASILAKVTRDRIMVEMDAEVPGYSFAVHKGYSTALHMSCLDQLGPSDQHRMSYRNVASRRRPTTEADRRPTTEVDRRPTTEVDRRPTTEVDQHAAASHLAAPASGGRLSRDRLTG